MKPRKSLSREEALKMVVVVNTLVRTEERGEELNILIPRKKSFWVSMLSSFLAFDGEKKVVLDKLGAEVYGDCRKGLPVSEIVANFQKRHDISEDRARQSVLLYLKMLAQRSIIGFLSRKQ